MKESTKQKISVIIVCLFVAYVVSHFRCSKYNEKLTALLSIDAQQVTIFRIYPRVSLKPVGTPVIFTAPDPIIDDFFQALTDRRSYPTSRDLVARDHNWLLEVAAEGVPTIQISFIIPHEKGRIVVGRIGEFSANDHSYDGDFQSQQLYSWYHTYSHRWLTPGNTS